MLDIFHKYSSYYDDPVVRPQPIDFVLAYFKNKFDSGFFIDVGAHNGITWSNSVALKEFLNWNGLCIEANPKVFNELQKNRPNDICLNIGSADSDGEMLFWKISGYAEMLSGFYDDYDQLHIDRINKEIGIYGGDIEKINISVEKLETTLSNHNINKIDYLSIDVEGAELRVLKGLNLNKNRPTLISIEDNGYTKEPHEYLLNNKYNFLQRIAGDCFYENSILLPTSMFTGDNCSNI